MITEKSNITILSLNNFNYLNLSFFAFSFSTLLNYIFYGLGYFLCLLFIFYGIWFKKFKLNFNIIPVLVFLFFVIAFFLIFHKVQDFSMFLRVLMLFGAIFFSKSIRESYCFKPESIAYFFVIISILTSVVGLKQYFKGFSELDYFFLSYNDSMNEENIEHNIKRGLGIYFDPLTQVTIIGIAIHSMIYLKDNFNFNRILFYCLLAIFILSCLITLSRAGNMGLFLSFLIYFNANKFKYIISIFLLLLGCFFFGITVLFFLTDDLGNIQNLIDSILSIFQIANVDVEVSSRFSATGSYGSRMEGINEVLNNILNTEKLHQISKMHDARDLGFLSIPILYGFMVSIFVMLFMIFLLLKILFKFFFARGFFHYSLAIIFFILCQSLVTFQLDSFTNVFILVFFLTNKQINYVPLVFK